MSEHAIATLVDLVRDGYKLMLLPTNEADVPVDGLVIIIEGANTKIAQIVSEDALALGGPEIVAWLADVMIGSITQSLADEIHPEGGSGG